MNLSVSRLTGLKEMGTGDSKGIFCHEDDAKARIKIRQAAYEFGIVIVWELAKLSFSGMSSTCYASSLWRAK
jgi:hypothetical protein